MLILNSLLLSMMALLSWAHESPSITLNSDLYPSGSEVRLSSGSSFTLRCNSSSAAVHWTSTAFLLRYRGNVSDALRVIRSKARHTGTYRCQYQERPLEHHDSWLHLYITDSDDPSNIFITPRTPPPLMEEGDDFLFECMVTDPSVTDLAFRVEGDGKVGLPRGMNVTVDPRRGALIKSLSPAFKGKYVCSAKKDGKEYISSPLNLVLRRPVHPPFASISQDNFIRLEGESLEMTCLTNNPSQIYTVSWTHPHIKVLNVTVTRQYRYSRTMTWMFMNSTVLLPSVQLQHSGQYTCTATNSHGDSAMATTRLTVVDAPYLRLYLHPAHNANISSMAMAVNGKLLANVTANKTDGTRGANISNTVAVYGSPATVMEVWAGEDVKLGFVVEAYPLLHQQWWSGPQQRNTSHLERLLTKHDRSEAWLLLRSVRFEDRGPYTFYFSSTAFSGSQTIELRLYRSPTASIKLTEDKTLTCFSSGYPLPTISWYMCPGVTDTCGENSTYRLLTADLSGEEEEEEEEELQRKLPLPSINDVVTVECVARSRVGVYRDVFITFVTSAPKPVVFTPILIGASSTAALLFILLLVILFKYKQKPRYEILWKIVDGNQGNSYSFIDPTQLPYNQRWEFPREQLRLGLVVGAGAFGKVVEATAYGLLGSQDSITRVAVKMLKPSAHLEEREALMSELKILSHLGYHDNIVNLLGACTRGGPMLMITEYCCHGDLLNFLRGQAQGFLDSILSDLEEEQSLTYKNMEDRSVRFRSDSGISCCEYQEMRSIADPHQGGETERQTDKPTDRICVCDLLRFSYQVAQGLEFLSSRNCIHRDVAARNVLLTEGCVAKICDFGLARDINNDDNYIVKGNARLPVKWMSPESIFDCLYTTQSDVWSYGVLLWEIFSLGKSPYPNMVVDTNFYKMIKDGHHMSQPDFAPAEIYQLMIGCWDLNPTHRPTFAVIGQLIERLLPTSNEVMSHWNSQPSYLNMHQRHGNTDHREEEDGLKPTDEEEDIQGEEEEGLVRMKTMKNVYQVY